ncbi:MAG: Maf family protein [Actinomycetaceae bacterium]|nr:Maf family protein [Actinomycetaceae bacterium]
MIVLASASPARLSTLRAAGLDPLVRLSNVDEDAILQQVKDEAIETQVLALAKAKARNVADSLGPVSDNHFVIGCDSMLQHHGQVLGKPHSVERALQRCADLSGSEGFLHTGHWIVQVSPTTDSPLPRAELGKTATSKVLFNEFSSEEIAAYVATGEPLEVAGSFTIDGLGGAFVKSVEGDPHNVVGISLPLLRLLLNDLGVFWPSLWTKRST